MSRYALVSCTLMCVWGLGGCTLVRGVPASAPEPETDRSATAPRPVSAPTRPAAERQPPSVGGSYEVGGVTYPVWSDATDYVERGLASWYGEELAGRPTASGEPFDPYGMTAAHQSLPLGARVEVENLENGRTVIVLVNDRGPFHEDRVIDLSLAAAQALGFAEKGTARVEVRSLN